MIPEQFRWWRRISPHDLLALVLLVITSLGVYAALVLPIALRPGSLPVKAGQVSPQDLQAPKSIEYISTVRTDQARDAAERAIAPVYTRPDPVVARRQIERLRTTLDYILAIRTDATTDTAKKEADLLALSDVRLDAETANRILSLYDARWLSVQQDALRVLEMVLRGQVRDDSLDTIRGNLSSLVSLALTEDQTAIVVALVDPFLVANSLYSPELTDAARAQARQAVEPVTQTYVAGEIVIQRGEVLTPADIEALETLGLIRPNNPTLDYLGDIAMVAVTMAFVGMYFHRRRPGYYNDGRSLILIAVLFLAFLVAARLVIPNRTIIPYVFPLSAFGLLVATLFGPGGGVILSFALCILTAYGLPNALDLTFFYLLSSLTGVLSLGKAHRVSSFLWAALISAAAGTAVITAYRLPDGTLDVAGYFTLVGASLLNGISSASVALMLQYILAEFLGLTTALRLLELARPDAPLLKYFLRNAPGTYQHSLQVANLVEQAAEKLGLDTLLMRIGALYHDVGKAANPSFFIENQIPGNLNPHDDVNPETAAASIIQHVPDGVTLAHKYRLPRRLQDFMLEHHGTLMAGYYYNKAVKAAGGDLSKVDSAKFRYPGPRPRSRETALLMLADNVEARTRSESPRNEEEVRVIVQKAIDYCQKEGQLADTRFTLKDLTAITEVFTTALTGIYHPRIRYPASSEPTQSDSPTLPAAHTEKK